MSTDVIVVNDSETIVIQNDETTIIEQLAVGPQGPPGPPGTGTIDTDALHISMRLSEFDTPTAKAQARINLELEYIDGGTFN